MTGFTAVIFQHELVEIEKEAHGYDVELANGLDLTFDRKFRMRIDD